MMSNSKIPQNALVVQGRHLSLTNRQRTRRINRRLLEEIVDYLLREHFPHQEFELNIHLVAAPAMAQLNEGFLGHHGSTDVLTFDYADVPSSGVRRPKSLSQPRSPALSGEIFICLDDAITQAREFRTTWQSELVRYIIHGLLHLHGFDDLNPALRRRMKREENRILRAIRGQFHLRALEASHSPGGARRGCVRRSCP